MVSIDIFFKIIILGFMVFFNISCFFFNVKMRFRKSFLFVVIDKLTNVKVFYGVGGEINR